MVVVKLDDGGNHIRGQLQHHRLLTGRAHELAGHGALHELG